MPWVDSDLAVYQADACMCCIKHISVHSKHMSAHQVQLLYQADACMQGHRQRPEWLHQRCPVHDVPAEEPVPVPGLRLPSVD